MSLLSLLISRKIKQFSERNSKRKFHEKVERDQGRWSVVVKNAISPVNNYGTCFKCDGKGKVKYDCQGCNGSGKYSAVCRPCGGTGAVSVKDTECRNCGGEGILNNMLCPGCKGNKVWQAHPPKTCDGCLGSGVYKDDCKKCTGAGRFNATCNKCGGSGLFKKGKR